MSQTRKLAAILVADVVGYSRLAGADEDRILARLRTLRSDLIDPTIAVHHGRIVKRTGDGSIIEFRSVVDAVNCAIEIQRAMVERNAEVAPDKRIEFRVGIHLGDVVEEADGDLMGDGVNIAARLEGVAKPGGICISDDAYRQVKSRLDLRVSDLGPVPLKNIAEPMRAYSLEIGAPPEARSPPPTDQAKPAPKRRSSFTALAAAVAALVLLAVASGWYMLGGRLTKPAQAAHLSVVVLPFTNLSGDPSHDYFADGVTENLTTELSRIKDSFVIARNTAFTLQGQEHRRQRDRQRARRSLRARRIGPARPEPSPRQRAARRRRIGRASLGRPFRGGHGRPVQATGSSGGAIGQQLRLGFGRGRSRKGRSVKKSGRHRSDHAGLDLDVARHSATRGRNARQHSAGADLVRPRAPNRSQRRRCFGWKRQCLPH
jgi:class 3 adenylate cyclase